MYSSVVLTSVRTCVTTTVKTENIFITPEGSRAPFPGALPRLFPLAVDHTRLAFWFT